MFLNHYACVKVFHKYLCAISQLVTLLFAEVMFLCHLRYAVRIVLAYVFKASATIRYIVAEIDWLPSVTPQEPIEPMVEIDLDYVIKQKYIEREVLDKIRAEIETKYGQCDICEYFENYDYEENDISEYRPIGNIADILQIIDRYRAESEARNDTNSTADL